MNKQFKYFSFLSKFTFFVENLALHRPTTELYPFSSKNPSGKLVDGMKSNLAYAGGQCTATLENKEIAMWKVDLERISQVERIVVYARTDNKKWGNL